VNNINLFFTYQEAKMRKIYEISIRERIGYDVIILSELSNFDKSGIPMRAKVIADFGNANNNENVKNAELVKKLLIDNNK
jgi:hypothetical protein